MTKKVSRDYTGSYSFKSKLTKLTKLIGGKVNEWK